MAFIAFMTAFGISTLHPWIPLLHGYNYLVRGHVKTVVYTPSFVVNIFSFVLTFTSLKGVWFQRTNGIEHVGVLKFKSENWKSIFDRAKKNVKIRTCEIVTCALLNVFLSKKVQAKFRCCEIVCVFFLVKLNSIGEHHVDLIARQHCFICHPMSTAKNKKRAYCVSPSTSWFLTPRTSTIDVQATRK